MNRSVLIVDDNLDLLHIYSLALSDYNCEKIILACDGIEAINKFLILDKKPDIILLDYHMPKLNGIETAKVLMRIKPDNNIIMISADTTIIEEAMKIGIKGFIKKPVDFKCFSRLILEIIPNLS
ncbi:MAG: response regulator [Candidatus Hodarchaeales archaeon]|jgi:response regulator of citrate/malate metabolism